MHIRKAGMDMKVATAEHGMKMTELAAEVQANRANAQTEVAKAQAMPMPVMGGMEHGAR